jgi:hypothetical protein
MRGVPAIAANPREGSRLLWFWVKVPNSNSEIGTTRRARPRVWNFPIGGNAIFSMSSRSPFQSPPFSLYRLIFSHAEY